MSYQPTPDDVQCQNPACREWYHQMLLYCPMCDTQKGVVPGSSKPPAIQQVQSVPIQGTGITYAVRGKVAASVGEANLNAVQNESKAGCAGFVGALLTLTGIGAIVGVPLMVWAAYLHFTKHKDIGQKEIWVGACPHCAERLHVDIGVAAVACPLCSKMIIVEARGIETRFRAG